MSEITEPLSASDAARIREHEKWLIDGVRNVPGSGTRYLLRDGGTSTEKPPPERQGGYAAKGIQASFSLEGRHAYVSPTGTVHYIARLRVTTVGTFTPTDGRAPRRYVSSGITGFEYRRGG